LTKVTALYGRNKLVRIILQGSTTQSKTGPMKKTQKKRKTSFKDVLIGWFTKPIEVKSILTTKAQVKTMDKTKDKEKDKARNKAKKTVHSKSTAKLKEKLKAESQARAEAEKRLKAEIKAREKAEAILKAKSKKRKGPQAQAKAKEVKVEEEVEAEEKFRSCAKEIKDCIELINKSGDGTAVKPNRENEQADMYNIDSKASKKAGNYKATGSKEVDKGTKSIGQGASPADMVMLVAKAEENISKAVIKAKAKDDKKAKRAKRKS
jgi:hypothetical protein